MKWIAEHQEHDGEAREADEDMQSAGHSLDAQGEPFIAVCAGSIGNLQESLKQGSLCVVFRPGIGDTGDNVKKQTVGFFGVFRA
jgi:hypothetical protein